MRDRGLEKLIKGAAAHGRQSDPEHEVGDLIEVLTSCWKRLSRDERLMVLGSHAEIVEWGTK